MKKAARFNAIIISMAVSIITTSSCQKEPATELKGRLEIISGCKMLTVWGSHYEMGYAQGYLLGGSFLKMFDEYVLADLISGEEYEMNARPYIIDNCVDPAETPYGEELSGLYDGWRKVSADSGWSTESAILGRELDINDFYAVQFVPDVAFKYASKALSCSSLSAWGDATKSDPELSGGVVYSRILDWSPSDVLIESSVIVVYQPDDKSEHGWVSFGYPFFIGCLTGFSSDGICASYNLGNNYVAADETEKHWPVLWAIRRGLETDVNDDGFHTADDVYSSVAECSRAGTHIIHCTEPYSLNASTPAFVIEANSKAIAMRFSSDEPDIAPDHLIATNHFRKLYEPEYCNRYLTLFEEFKANPSVTTARAWELEDSVSTWWSVMKVLMRPDKRDFYFTYGDGIGKPLEDALHCTLDNLF